MAYSLTSKHHYYRYHHHRLRGILLVVVAGKNGRSRRNDDAFVMVCFWLVLVHSPLLLLLVLLGLLLHSLVHGDYIWGTLSAIALLTASCNIVRSSPVKIICLFDVCVPSSSKHGFVE